MTTIEAYNLTLDKINELRESGINVSMKPSRSRDNRELEQKYSGEDRIPSKLWYFVTFEIKNSEQARKIMEAGNYLGMCGIRFDTGGMGNIRDWEIDWSFSYSAGEDNYEWILAREDVEDIINENKNDED